MFSVSMSAGSDIIDKAELLTFFFFSSSFFFVDEMTISYGAKKMHSPCNHFREYFILLKVKRIQVLAEVSPVFVVPYGACALFPEIFGTQVRSTTLY